MGNLRGLSRICTKSYDRGQNEGYSITPSFWPLASHNLRSEATKMVNGAKRWVWTLNNPTDDEEQALGDAAANEEEVEWCLFGRETGDSGTPHLQGAIIFKRRKTILQVKTFLGSERYHLEIMRGRPDQSEAYCKKDEDWEEFGTCPSVGGEKKGMKQVWNEFEAWLKGLDHHPTDEELKHEYPHLISRYPRFCEQLIQMWAPVLQLVPEDAEPREWQNELRGRLLTDAEGRKVMFVVDEEGASGKTWFCQWMSSKDRDVQVLGLGKRDDIAHQIDPSKRIFLFTLPRGCIDHLQYPVLEMLKDRMVVSPKYESTVKKMRKQPHVVVFCNEVPKLDRMTSDRYEFFTYDGMPFLSVDEVRDRVEQAEADERERARGAYAPGFNPA